jgi:type III secretion protein U
VAGGEKTLPPTQRHLRKLAEKGQAPQSRLMRTFLGLVVTVAIAAALARLVVDKLILHMAGALTASASPSPTAVAATLVATASDIFGCVAMILGGATAAIVLIAVLEGGQLRFVPGTLSPKFERFNPVQGLGRLFKLQNLVETLQGILASALWLGSSAVLVWAAIGSVLVAPLCGLDCIGTSATALGERLMLAFFCIFGVFALSDMKISRALFRHQNRMSEQEVKEEHKDSNGNPEVRGELSASRSALMLAPGRAEIARHVCLGLRSGRRAILISFDPVLRRPPTIAWRGPADEAETYLAGIGRQGIRWFDDRAAFRSLKKGRVGQFVPESSYGEVIPLLFAVGKLG